MSDQSGWPFHGAICSEVLCYQCQLSERRRTNPGSSGSASTTTPRVAQRPCAGWTPHKDQRKLIATVPICQPRPQDPTARPCGPRSGRLREICVPTPGRSRHPSPIHNSRVPPPVTRDGRTAAALSLRQNAHDPRKHMRTRSPGRHRRPGAAHRKVYR